MNLFPNPVSDMLSIKSHSEIKKLAVFNLLGQKVMVKENTNILNVNKLKPGAYILKIVDENDSVSTKKFIKSN